MRNLVFALLLCNVWLLNAQSLELEHWKIINSSEVTDEGDQVSQIAYPANGWYSAIVPTTVLNCIVK